MKDFFTYEQQVEKLCSQNKLIIDDVDQAIEDLKWEGYYNLINGYSFVFKKDDVFINGTKFADIIFLYRFDKNIRAIIYKYTSTIECHIKALIGHEFSRVYGVDEKKYLLSESFSTNKKTQEKIKKLINICNDTIEKATKKRSDSYREYVAHNLLTHGHVPFWVLIRALTFGTTSLFFEVMKRDEKNAIAINYGLTGDELTGILKAIVAFRNIVAHGERIFCAKLPTTVVSDELTITKKLSIPKNKKGENKYGRNDFLALLICCKYLLPSLDFDGLIFELNMEMDRLEDKLQPKMALQVKRQMGLEFNNWKKLPKMKI